MPSKNKKAEKQVDFSDLSPKVNFEKARFSKLYEKAFFKPADKPESDFSRNTTTWD